MGITKYIGRLVLCVLISIAFSGMYTDVSAMTTSQTAFSLPGLSFSPPKTTPHMPMIMKPPLTMTFETSKIMIKNPKKISSLNDLLPLPTSTPIPEKPKYSLVSQVYAAEITEAEVTATPTQMPTTTPVPHIITTSTSAPNPGGLNADVLFSLVNNYRSAANLPPFQKDDRACSLAVSRAPEIAGEIASGHMHAGMYGRNLPYWNTENIISMNSETAAFNWWINDPIHHDAIVGPYTYSCIACSGNSCAEEFTNFQPK